MCRLMATYRCQRSIGGVRSNSQRSDRKKKEKNNFYFVDVDLLVIRMSKIGSKYTRAFVTNFILSQTTSAIIAPHPMNTFPPCWSSHLTSFRHVPSTNTSIRRGEIVAKLLLSVTITSPSREMILIIFIVVSLFPSFVRVFSLVQGMESVPLHYTSWKTSGVTLAGLDDALHEPVSLYATKDGILYVVDRGNHRVIKYGLSDDRIGTQIGDGRGNRSRQLDSPTTVVVNEAMNAVHISDYGNHRIQLWNKGGSGWKCRDGDRETDAERLWYQWLFAGRWHSVGSTIERYFVHLRHAKSSYFEMEISSLVWRKQVWNTP